MTAVVGMICSDGIVMAADQQISVPGQFKYHERKIEVHEGPDWTVTFAYAGSPGLMKEAKGKMLERLGNDGPGVTPEAVHAVAESALEAMGRQYVELDLELMIATATASNLELLRFDGQSKALYVADGINCLGIGDSSLIRFLSESLYSRTMDTVAGSKLGVYLISKAKEYVDHCGGDTNLIRITKGCKPEWAKFFSVMVCETSMQKAEKDFFREFLEQHRGPFDLYGNQ